MEQTKKDLDTHRFPHSRAVALGDFVELQQGSVVSKMLLKRSTGNVTLFAFDEGQGLSEHSAPFDALVLGVDGEALLTIGGEEVAIKQGEAVLMPANIPHGLKARTPFKMMLVMIRDAG